MKKATWATRPHVGCYYLNGLLAAQEFKAMMINSSTLSAMACTSAWVGALETGISNKLTDAVPSIGVGIGVVGLVRPSSAPTRPPRATLFDDLFPPPTLAGLSPSAVELSPNPATRRLISAVPTPKRANLRLISHVPSPADAVLRLTPGDLSPADAVL